MCASGPGTDIPLIWGMLWHIFENGWEDKEYIRQRVWGMDEVRKEVDKWTPEEPEQVTGVPGEQLKRVAETLATKNRPNGDLVHGRDPAHRRQRQRPRFLHPQLATGNIGKAGTGANIFRGHDNVQGATDFGLDLVTLPGYYGLWRAHGGTGRACGTSTTTGCCRGSRDKRRQAQMMETPAFRRPLGRRRAGEGSGSQKDNLKAMFFLGHGGKP